MDKSEAYVSPISRISKEHGKSYQIIPTRGFVFAYDSDTTIRALAEKLIEINDSMKDDEKINLICVLNRGLIFYQNIENKKMDLVPSERSKVAFYDIENLEEGDTLLWFYNILYNFLSQAWTHPTNVSKYLWDIQMNPINIKVDASKWICEHCNQEFETKPMAENHEKECDKKIKSISPKEDDKFSKTS